MNDVYVISLESSGTRRAEFSKVAEGCGVDWTFENAATELREGMRYEPESARRSRGRPLLPQELGCYASHFSLWKMVSRHTRGIVVLEDDVIPDWKFVREFLAAVNDETPSYLRFYSRWPAPSVTRGTMCGRHILEFLGHPYGTQAYYVGPEAARRFVTQLAQVLLPVDDAMDRSWQHGVKNMGLFPFPVLERHGASTIGNRDILEQGSLQFQLGRLRIRLKDKLRKELYFAKRRVSSR